MEQILNKIKEYKKILIHGHKRPDGDCLGSQFGLQSIIKESFPDKEVYVVGEVSDYVSFLGTPDTITDDTYNNALVIVVDCGNKDRISDQRFNLAKEIIKIDHHEVVEDYGTINYVEVHKAACAQIITEFMVKYNLKISKEGATALYVGILTDTGRFRFDSVNGDTLRAAARLIDLGVDVEYVDARLSIETMNTIRLKGYVLENFETTPSGFAYIKMTRDVINRFEVSDENAAALVSNLGGIEGYPVWALFMEYPDNEIRIRLRSRGPRIDLLANQYRGGGHQKASGASLENWDELEKFIEDVDNLLKEYKEKMAL